MEETINDRLEMLINERFNGNKAAFSSSINLPPTSLSNYIGKSRRSKLSVDIVTNIVTILGVDPMWLLTGKKSETCNNATATNNSVAANGSVHIQSGDTAVLQERVARLEELVKEKERLIQVLMEKK